MSLERIRRYAVRGLIVALCLAAWADLRPFSGTGRLLPVALIDISRSVGGGGPTLPEGLRVRPHWLLIGDGFQRVVGDAEPVRLGREATSLGSALRESAALWPGADVLLLTDGRGTDGGDLAAARAVAAGGGRVFVAPPTQPAADVGLLQARVLSTAPEVQILAEIGASTTGSGELRLSRMGKVIDRVPLDFRPGQSEEVTLRDANPPAEGASYRLVLMAAAGTPNDDGGNDSLSVALRPQQRVALTWGLEEDVRGFAGPRLVVRRVEEAGPDTDPGDLAAADCLVMANLPFADVGTEAGDAIEGFVASGGCLLIVGGPSAYAGGGWAGTRFEKHVSPLRVPREEGTGLALVLAVDRSGSTAGTTLAHLQEAVRRALQGIVPGERMAVLPFARRPADSWLKPGIVDTAVEPVRIAELFDAVDALEPGGDTDLVLAISEAVRRVQDIPARNRRVIVLTDGDPDRAPDVEALREVGLRAREAGVQVAALVVGDPTAVQVLRETVATRPDHVQALDDPQALPARLLHWLGGVRGEKAELPRPDRLVRAAGTFDGGGALDGFLPRKLERLEVASDDGGRALIVAEYNDLQPPKDRVPFMAQRRVGAGQVVGLAWGPVWEKRREREAALMRLKPWVALLASSADRGLGAEVVGRVLTVRYPGASGAGGLAARSQRSASTLIEVEPGLFRGPLPEASEKGVWVSPAREGAAPGDRTQERPLRLPSRPPAESQGVGLDLVRMAALAEAGGGVRLEAGVQPPRPIRDRGRPLAPWLLLAACALLLLDRLWSKPLGSATDS